MQTLNQTKNNILLALFALSACDSDDSYSYSGGAISTLIGGAWSAYRRRQALDLFKRGLIVISVRGSENGKRYYCLSRAGYALLANSIQLASLTDAVLKNEE